MFQQVAAAPPDAILGITEAFNKDPRADKINLSVGVFKDESGHTPVLPSVKEAERRLLAQDTTKDYLPIDGSPTYGRLVRDLVFTPAHEVVASGRSATSHTPSGTAAVRVAADYLKRNHPSATVWMSDPTWPNHPQIFQAAGLATKTYPYFDPATNALSLERMIAALGQVPAGDVVLLHGCCHNPSGVDPTPDQWRRIAQVMQAREALPLMDFAYQGFGDGLREDAVGVEALAQPGREMLIASSFSKNFGLYRERVGALTVLAQTAAAAANVQSQVKSVIRANYSNPPHHGGAIVATILGDAALRTQWETELKAMRDRIHAMRTRLVSELASRGVKRDFSFIARQKGMFSFSGLTKDQTERLKAEFGVYVVGNGRINVAGITSGNMGRLCDALAKVLA